MERNTFLYPTFPAGILCLWGLFFGIHLYGMDYKDLESCDELTEFVGIGDDGNELPPRYAPNQLEEDLIKLFDSFTLIRKSNGNNNTNKRNSW